MWLELANVVMVLMYVLSVLLLCVWVSRTIKQNKKAVHGLANRYWPQIVALVVAVCPVRWERSWRGDDYSLLYNFHLNDPLLYVTIIFGLFVGAASLTALSFIRRQAPVVSNELLGSCANWGVISGLLLLLASIFSLSGVFRGLVSLVGILGVYFFSALWLFSITLFILMFIRVWRIILKSPANA